LSSEGNGFCAVFLHLPFSLPRPDDITKFLSAPLFSIASFLTSPLIVPARSSTPHWSKCDLCSLPPHLSGKPRFLALKMPYQFPFCPHSMSLFCRLLVTPPSPLFPPRGFFPFSPSFTMSFAFLIPPYFRVGFNF